MESHAIIAMMIEREIFSKLLERLAAFPAVALLGPRQVGKTTLAMQVARQISSVYLDLESPEDLSKLTDPQSYLRLHENKLVILDEVQRIPHLFQVLRGLVDEGKRKGLTTTRFLLLGSASVELIKQSSESLAGRIAYLELPCLNLNECGKTETNKLWVRGGFPNSFLASTDGDSYIWRENFIRTYLERDIPQLGPRIPAETLRRFWTMLAHNQGTLLNSAQLARNLAVDGKTVARYLDLMVDLLLLRLLPPWHNNAGKRLVKSPKIFIRDSGLVHALLRIIDHEDLLSHPVVGSSWEGLVIENIISSLAEGSSYHFYRTSSGAEIDLLLCTPGNKVYAIEIKRSVAPKIEKGFYVACNDLEIKNKYIVYPGHDQYFIGDQVKVISLSGMLSELRDSKA